ncbi:hypothetical protein CBM2633_B90081 [Cupriavidus taiwanensis]|uniref:Uncharacterized protein n=1 Tax=Cupriavidus taiwanensis TaxID=164546 RepID=A0A375J3N0_9BURK|nr:hypothetical protein CBM2633_B90081 [Cupriavidus taiwanensis]SPR99784.1 hypothetical protein CBM2634_B100177 [Cupriavidus taiwanensis]
MPCPAHDGDNGLILICALFYSFVNVRVSY